MSSCLKFPMIGVRLCVVLALAVTCVSLNEALGDAKIESARHGARRVALFDAIDAGDVEAILIPRDSRRVTIQVRNKTDRPLAVQLPKAFAGVPALAQIGFPGGGPGIGLGLPGGGGGGGAPQALGGGFPGGGNPAAGGPGVFGGPGIFGGPAGFMNIPPGKVVKVKRSSVCLEHGKAEPGPKHAYRIAPLEEVTGDAGVRELLALFACDRYPQRVAQIAAWHLANDMSWKELAGLTIKRFNGRRVPRFSREEIRAAQRLVGVLPSQRKRNSDKSDSLSRR